MEPTELVEELQAEMRGLVIERDHAIRYAERMIREANKRFDKLAVPLGKRINQLRDSLPSEPTEHPTKVRCKVPVMDGLTDREQAHFQELLTKRGNHK